MVFVSAFACRRLSRNLDLRFLIRGTYYFERSITNNSCYARRQGFNRQASKPNGNGNSTNNQQKGNSSQNSSPTTYAPTMPPLKTSASFSSTLGSNTENSPCNADLQIEPEPTKFFFREKYARLGVRGNFMPLAAQPKNVDLGEWLAHQCKDALFRAKTPANLPSKQLLNNIALSSHCSNAFRR